MRGKRGIDRRWRHVGVEYEEAKKEFKNKNKYSYRIGYIYILAEGPGVARGK